MSNPFPNDPGTYPGQPDPQSHFHNPISQPGGDYIMSENTRQDNPVSEPKKSRSAPPAEFDLNRLTTADRVVGAASLVALISIWLPWYTFYGYSASGTSGHGWLWLEFLVAAVLLAYLTACALWDTLPFTLPRPHATVLLIATIVQLGLITIAVIDVPYGNDGVGLGWGAFVGLFAALVALKVLAVPAFIARSNNSQGGTAQ
jgi:hypothetical protein